MKKQPHYLDKNSTQTLQEGIAEYYQFNPHITAPVLEFEPLLDRSLLDIRREFDLLQFIQ